MCLMRRGFPVLLVCFQVSCLCASEAREGANTGFRDCFLFRLLGRRPAAEQGTPGYVAIEHVPYKGFTHVPGSETNVGNSVTVVFKPRNSKPVELRGRIGAEYEAGFVLVDEAGESHSLNTVDGDFVSIKVQPEFLKWRKANAINLPDEATGTHSLALLHLETTSGSKILFGTISEKTLEDGYRVIEVKSPNGDTHLIDPKYHYMEAELIPDTEANRKLFPSVKRVPHTFDETRRQRKEFAGNVQAEGNMFASPKLVEFLSRDLSNTRRLLTRWYSTDGAAIMKQVEGNLGEKFLPLLAEPGLVMRWKEFIPFAQGFLVKSPQATPWQVREAFSAKLGKRKIYRGMVLTEEEAKGMQQNGIWAPGMKDASDRQTRIVRTLNPDEGGAQRSEISSPSNEIASRLSDYRDERSGYLSVSSYDTVAKSVGYHTSGKTGDPTRKLFLFEIELPEIDLVRVEGVFGFLGEHHRAPLTIGTETFLRSQDTTVEMFVPYHIAPGQIVSVKQEDAKPPEWRSGK